jgi:polysaccharide export outer membrane protein
MRIAIVSALLAGICVWVVAAQEAQQTPPAAKPPQSISPLVPVGPVETDPAKMAGAPASGTTKAPAAAETAKTYIIGAEDVVKIIVLNEPGLTSDYPVRPDGRISIPLAGEVTVAGLTPEQVEEAVAQRLKDNKMLLDPHVYCEVMGFHSKRYFISGEVGKTGSFDLVVPTRVSEALAQAGGFKDFAKITKIRILRNVPGAKPQLLLYNDKEVSHGKKVDQNIYLQPGDHIYVD